MKKKLLIGAFIIFTTIFVQAQTNKQGYYAHDGDYGQITAEKDNLIIKEFPMEDSGVLFTLKKGQNVSFGGRHKINKSSTKTKKWYNVYFTICDGKLVDYNDFNYKGCKGKEERFDGWIYSEHIFLNSY